MAIVRKDPVTNNKKSGIYRLTNTKSGKTYVGQSTDIFRRKRTHFTKLKGNKHSNKPMQRDFNAVGMRYFRFEVLELCPLHLMNEKEIFWIDFYKSDTKEKGYNLTAGGGYHRDAKEGVELTSTPAVKTTISAAPAVTRPKSFLEQMLAENKKKGY